MSQRAKSDFDSGDNKTLPDAQLSQLRSKLARAVRASCPQWLSNSADDIIQAAMLRVVEIAKKNEGKLEFKSSYLWQAAYSALVDEIRRCRRRREVEFSETAAFPSQKADSPDPEQLAEASEIGDIVDDCLKLLLRPRRLAVTAYLHGHTVPETARLLGWTVKKVENLVYRGLAELRKCLRLKGVRR